MIRIAIVEDENSFIEQLTGYLREYQKISKEEFKITVYRDGDGILASYQAQFDIILMDIQMKLVDGMSAAEEIRKQDSEVVIMFITNMTQYAIRGYEVDALDYILKPVSYFAFCQKLGKAIDRVIRKNSPTVTLSVKDGIMRVKISDIYYIESEGHNLIIHTASGNYVASGTMKEMEKEYLQYHFCRGNKCYLINLEHVEGIKEKCAVVKGELLQLSRPRINDFMKELTKYWGDSK